MSGSLQDVRGFNYSGSWGTSGLDLWQHHDNGTMALEVARGKGYFPRWNTARWWLSHAAFQRNPERFLANFDAGLAIFASHGIAVMPVLFNRWLDPVCDFGGVSLDHIVSSLSFDCEPDSFVAVDTEQMRINSSQRVFVEYLRAVVGSHTKDDRVFAWDLCNEPLPGPYFNDEESAIRQAELRWLGWCAEICRNVGADQPLTIGNWAHPEVVEATEPIVDFISFNPYFIPSGTSGIDADDFSPGLGTEEGYEELLDRVLDFGRQSGKDVVASETFFGAVEDLDRAELISYTIKQLSTRNIGFFAHALHHSLVADLHAAPYGPVGGAGRLEFINADGTLRSGHEVFNDY